MVIIASSEDDNIFQGKLLTCEIVNHNVREWLQQGTERIFFADRYRLDADELIQTWDPGYLTANYFTRVSPKNSSMTSSFCHWFDMKDDRWAFRLLRDYDGHYEYLDTNVTVSNCWDVTSMGWYPVFKTCQLVMSK